MKNIRNAFDENNIGATDDRGVHDDLVCQHPGCHARWSVQIGGGLKLCSRHAWPDRRERDTRIVDAPQTLQNEPGKDFMDWEL